MSTLAWYALGYAAAAALHKGLGFVLILWLAHSLSVAEYANFGLLFALQTGIAALATAGIGDAVVSKLSPRADRARLFAAANGVFALLAVAAALGGAVVFTAFAWPAAGGTLSFVAVLAGGLLGAFFTLQSTLVRLEEHHAAALVLGALAPLAGVAGACAGFVATRTVDGFFLGMASGLATTLVVLRILGVGQFRVKMGDEYTRALRAEVLPYLAVALLAWIGGYGNTYGVKAFFGAADVAAFTFVFTLSAVMQLVATSMNQVWSPRFFRLARELPVHDLEAQNARFYAVQGGVLGIVGGLMLLLLSPMIDWFGGNLATYRSLHVELLLLLAAYAAAIPWWHAQNYFLVHGAGKPLMNLVIISSVAGIAVWLASMALLGTIGIYTGLVAQYVVRTATTFWWARRQWGIRLAWQGPLAALAVLSLAAAAAHHLHGTPSP